MAEQINKLKYIKNGSGGNAVARHRLHIDNKIIMGGYGCRRKERRLFLNAYKDDERGGK